MFTRRRADAPATRGQAMVEFALVLPLLALLLVMAIDFGRVFFGWVGVHNAARIGANYAALHPFDADWGVDGDPEWEEYKAQILADAAAINCELPDPLPTPSFPGGKGPGQDAVVSLTCGFNLITPLASNLIGSPLEIGAQATFPIRTGIVGMPDTGGGGEEEDDPLCRDVPDLSSMSAADARLAWELAGFSGTFSPASGQDTKIVVTDSQVTNPSSSPGQCITFTATVTVTLANAPSCPAGDSLVPELTGLLVDQARTRWASNGFTNTNFDPDTGFGDQMVTDWETDPDFNAGACAPSDTTTVDVEYGQPPEAAPCEVPDFIGSRANQAQAAWSGAGFETTVQFSNADNFKIGKQSINSGAFVSCSSAVILVEP